MLYIHLFNLIKIVQSRKRYRTLELQMVPLGEIQDNFCFVNLKKTENKTLSVFNFIAFSNFVFYNPHKKSLMIRSPKSVTLNMGKILNLHNSIHFALIFSLSTNYRPGVKIQKDILQIPWRGWWGGDLYFFKERQILLPSPSSGFCWNQNSNNSLKISSYLLSWRSKR